MHNIDWQKDFYAVMGVPKDASKDDIKSRYKELAKQYHPDRNPGDAKAEQKFKEINEANDILKDDQKRSQYDALRASGGPQARYRTYRTNGGFGPDDFGVNNMSREEVEELLRQAMRGNGFGGFGGFRDVHQVNPDERITIDLTLEEGFNGVEKEIVHHAKDGNTKKVKVKFPPGINNGQMICCDGMGNKIYEDKPASDLYVRVRLKPHKEFVLDGHHIQVTKSLDVLDAITGTKLIVNTLEGNIEVTIPPGTQPETIMRLRGKGYKHVKNPAFRGDMFLKLKVVIPKYYQSTIDAIEKLKKVVTDEPKS